MERSVLEQLDGVWSNGLFAGVSGLWVHNKEYRPRLVDYLFRVVSAALAGAFEIWEGDRRILVSKTDYSEAVRGFNRVQKDHFADANCRHLKYDFLGYTYDQGDWIERRSVLGPIIFLELVLKRGTGKQRLLNRELEAQFCAFWLAGEKARSRAELEAHIDAFAARYASYARHTPAYAIESAIGRRPPNPPDPIREGIARAHDWLLITNLRRFHAAVEACGDVPPPGDKPYRILAPRPLFLAAAQVQTGFIYIFLQVIRDNFGSFFIDSGYEDGMEGNLRPALGGDLKQLVMDGVRSKIDDINRGSPLHVPDYDDACFELIDLWEAEGGTDILSSEKPFWLAEE